MKVICLTVGKKHSPSFEPAIAVYEKRLKPLLNFNFEYIAVSDKHQESISILKRLKDDDLVWLLDENGTLIDNHQLSQKIESAMNMSIKRLVIVIGGPYGVDESVRERSRVILSLSKLVFPHQLVRLILVEQLYRSINILNGGKYHHD